MSASGAGAPLVIWGASGHARVLAEFAGVLGLRLVALFDNDPAARSPFPEVPLFHGRAGLAQWSAGTPRPGTRSLIAIGGSRGADRLELQALLDAHGVPAATVVHPTAFVAGDVALGAGSQVLALAAVGAAARLGRQVIVNTRASVDHECVLADGVHVAPGATLAGCVEVGANTLVGAGAVVLPRLRLGDNVVVGAGAVVTRDVPAGSVVVGNPARVVRPHP